METVLDDLVKLLDYVIGSGRGEFATWTVHVDMCHSWIGHEYGSSVTEGQPRRKEGVNMQWKASG
jgi:hypothetical protein